MCGHTSRVRFLSPRSSHDLRPCGDEHSVAVIVHTEHMDIIVVFDICSDTYPSPYQHQVFKCECVTGTKMMVPTVINISTCNGIESTEIHILDGGNAFFLLPFFDGKNSRPNGREFPCQQRIDRK